MLRINQYISNLFLLLFPLYYLINYFNEGSIPSKLCILTIILISGIYFVKSLFLNEHKNFFYNAWTLFLTVNIIGFIFNFDLSAGYTRDMFRSTLTSLLTFYPVYYFSKKEQIKSIHLIIFLLILIPVFILQYYKLESSVLASRLSGNTNVVNNMAYPFVNLLPYLFLIKKQKLFSGLLMIILMFFIIQASKRGALITGSIGMLMFFWYNLNTIEKRHRIAGFILVVIIIFILSVIAYKTFTSNEFLLGRMTSILEGDSSGRNMLYKTIITKWYNSDNILKYMFGFGYAGSVYLIGNFAHNDWLENILNLGLIGFFTYLYLFYAAIKYCLNKEWMFDKRFLMITITLMWFFISLGSMSYSSLEGFIRTILLGYLIGSEKPDLV